jgi:hypothetical protein
MIKLRTLLLILLATLAFLASCRPVEPLAPEEPIVTLLAPSDGSTLVSGDVQIRIFLQNFEAVAPTGQPNTRGEGHVIYYLDAAAPLTAGTPATTSAGSFVTSAAQSYTWQSVPAGPHIFTVQLVNHDDTPLLPPVAVRANVIVKDR